MDKNENNNLSEKTHVIDDSNTMTEQEAEKYFRDYRDFLNMGK